jgi:hypothetical protein
MIASGSKSPTPAGERSRTTHSTRKARLSKITPSFGLWRRGVTLRSTPWYSGARPSDEICHLQFRQPQPSLGLKCVQPLDARIFRPKGESNALQRLNLEPFCLRAFCHRRRACHRNMAGQHIFDYLKFCGNFSLGISEPVAVGVESSVRLPAQSEMERRLSGRHNAWRFATHVTCLRRSDELGTHRKRGQRSVVLKLIGD